MGQYAIIWVTNTQDGYRVRIDDLDGVSAEHYSRDKAIEKVKSKFVHELAILSLKNKVPSKYTQDFDFVEHNSI